MVVKGGTSDLGITCKNQSKEYNLHSVPDRDRLAYLSCMAVKITKHRSSANTEHRILQEEGRAQRSRVGMVKILFQYKIKSRLKRLFYFS
jgi:hypothetical protein